MLTFSIAEAERQRQEGFQSPGCGRAKRLDENSILSHRACVTPARREKCPIFPGLRCTV
jgi:hypothetical protein